MEAALGDEIRVVLSGGDILAFRVVGVYEYDASSTMSFSMASDKDVSTGLYIPITTAKHLTGKADRYYKSNRDYSVMAMAMSSMLESMSTIMNTLSIAISVIAGISLLVGGIGVMNIMLVSVTERTREIGTRKALGATNNDIRIQFVVESIIVCLIGGIIGIILGTVMGYIGSTFISEPSYPTPGYIALAVGFSLALGFFFGYYPANKAAKLSPIEALRFE